MKFVSLTAAALAFALPAFAQSEVTATYDQLYDDGNLPLTEVACSNGDNGLITKGFTTLGSLPRFPNVGGVNTVSGWNSPECGACYNVTYGNNSIVVLAVDVAPNGVNLSFEALNNLTNGSAWQLGSVPVTVTPVGAYICGLW